MDRVKERILIVHAVHGVDPGEIKRIEEAIRTFERPKSSVRAEPIVFGIPAGVAPGSTIATVLTEDLRSCVGAIVFVDDLKPNVAYELGFFHGQGRTVLLLAHGRADSIWIAISDLAGAALVSLEQGDVLTAIHAYLNRLYQDMGTVSTWRAAELPSSRCNLLNRRRDLSGHPAFREDGEWGCFLQLNSWEGITIEVGWSLFPGAGFKIVLKALEHGADYSIYFRTRFTDRDGTTRRIWLGLTSLRTVAAIESDERNLPAQSPMLEWQMITGQFQDLLDRGHVHSSGPPSRLDAIRVRAGIHGESQPKRIEIGFIEVTGIGN